MAKWNGGLRDKTSFLASTSVFWNKRSSHDAVHGKQRMLSPCSSAKFSKWWQEQRNFCWLFQIYTDNLVFMSAHFSTSGYTDRWPICFILFLSRKDCKFTKDRASSEMGRRHGKRQEGVLLTNTITCPSPQLLAWAGLSFGRGRNKVVCCLVNPR